MDPNRVVEVEQVALRKDAHARKAKQALSKQRKKIPKYRVVKHFKDPNLQVEHLDRFAGWSSLRLMMHDFVEHPAFGFVILLVILMNTILISLQTHKFWNVEWGWYFALIDAIFLGIYIFEILLKMYVHRCEFFATGWNNFDLIIVAFSGVEILLIVVLESVAGFNPKIFRLLRVFRAVRAFRALRVLRTITFFQNLQVIVGTLLASIPAWWSISILLFLVIYIFAIIGVTLYADVLPSRFGDLWLSLFALFQLITLDDWFELYDGAKEEGAHSMIFYLIVFIVLETFIFINLFVAVIVNNLEHLQQRNLRMQKREKMKRKMELRAKEAKASDLFVKRAETASTRAATLQQEAQRQAMDQMGLHPRQRASVRAMLMLMACLESNLDTFERQQRVLDDLVDVTEEEQRDAVVSRLRVPGQPAKLSNL